MGNGKAYCVLGGGVKVVGRRRRKKMGTGGVIGIMGCHLGLEGGLVRWSKTTHCRNLRYLIKLKFLAFANYSYPKLWYLDTDGMIGAPRFEPEGRKTSQKPPLDPPFCNYSGWLDYLPCPTTKKFKDFDFVKPSFWLKWMKRQETKLRSLSSDLTNGYPVLSNRLRSFVLNVRGMSAAWVKIKPGFSFCV